MHITTSYFLATYLQLFSCLIGYHHILQCFLAKSIQVKKDLLFTYLYSLTRISTYLETFRNIIFSTYINVNKQNINVIGYNLLFHSLSSHIHHVTSICFNQRKSYFAFPNYSSKVKNSSTQLYSISPVQVAENAFTVPLSSS